MHPAPDAVTRALAQPHIVQSICYNLPDESLSTVALVNRQFFTFATEAKWDGAPLWVFRTRVQPSRRQIYASKVTFVLLDNQGLMAADHISFRRLVFDGLTGLQLDGYGVSESDNNHAILEPFLKPSIRVLTIEHSIIPAGLSALMGSMCNQLRELNIWENWGVDFPALAGFMAACPNLESFELSHRYRVPMGVSLAVQCARQPKLRKLECPPSMEIPYEAFGIIETEVSTPFASLESIMVAVPTTAMPFLSKWLTRVCELELDIHDMESAVLEPISHMKALKIVRLNVYSGYSFSEAEMMSLCSLPLLHTIAFMTEDHGDVPRASLDLSASQFAAWTSHLPGLHRLELPFQVSENYDTALIALASHCPNLSGCDWPAEIDFSALQLESRPAPLFPKLDLINCPSAVSSLSDDKFPHNLSEDDLLDVVRKQFPSLRSITTEVCVNDKGAKAIIEAVERLRPKYRWE